MLTLRRPCFTARRDCTGSLSAKARHTASPPGSAQSAAAHARERARHTPARPPAGSQPTARAHWTLAAARCRPAPRRQLGAGVAAPRPSRSHAPAHQTSRSSPCPCGRSECGYRYSGAPCCRPPPPTRTSGLHRWSDLLSLPCASRACMELLEEGCTMTTAAPAVSVRDSEGRRSVPAGAVHLRGLPVHGHPGP